MANLDQARAFVDSGGAKLPPRQTRARESKPKALRQRSDKQSAREAFLDGIKAERITAAIDTYGHVGCSRCPAMFHDFANAWRNLDLHHTEKRSRGQGYRGGRTFGVDAPEKLELDCRPCHRALESNPEWSGS